MTGREAVLQVAQKHPDWLEWVDACCRAQQAKPEGYRILASVPARILGKQTRSLLPLVKWGVLDNTGDGTLTGSGTRGGHRRFYRVRSGVCDALREVRY